MNQANIYRYSHRGDVDQQIEQMRARIIAERREEIGRRAAWQEAIDVTSDWWRAQYLRIEDEVTAQWGVDA